ncbi:MAG: ABC transporter ATP-binding protein [Candidatus Dadabacteria bacterium]|nr:MAG: ABC transporter ATP-binding protein [Candidatus Dadabacteria bacterium]
MEPVLRAEALEKSYPQPGGELRVLKGIDLVVEPGIRMAVVGPSGAGKSTLLHLLGGLDRPTGGTVRFGREDLFARSDPELARFRNRHVGFVFQFHHLLPEFTAVENVAFPARIAGVPRREAEARARDLLEQVGLAGRVHHRPGELSGGEQQRVAIARALICEPRVLLADEPTGNLDHNTGEAVHELLVEWNRRTGVALVVVTHNPELARRMDRVVTLVDGRIASVERNGP